MSRDPVGLRLLNNDISKINKYFSDDMNLLIQSIKWRNVLVLSDELKNNLEFVNLYGCVNNNPINNLDPLGLEKERCANEQTKEILNTAGGVTGIISIVVGIFNPPVGLSIAMLSSGLFGASIGCNDEKSDIEKKWDEASQTQQRQRQELKYVMKYGFHK